MIRYKGLLTLAFAVIAANAASEFRLVEPDQGKRLLPAYIVVPDRSSWDGVRRISENTTFYSQERFRLVLQPRESGHIYLFCHNSQGEFQLLYPQRADGDNYVDRHEKISLPAGGWFRFDEQPGQEELILVQSPLPLVDIEQAVERDDEVDSTTLQKYERWVDAVPRGTLVHRMLLDHAAR